MILLIYKVDWFKNEEYLCTGQNFFKNKEEAENYAKATFEFVAEFVAKSDEGLKWKVIGVELK